METVVLTVGGMSCEGCVRSVREVLAASAGVAQAEVDLAAAQARVQFNPQQTDAVALVQAVEDAGFDAEIAA
ncbi:MAG: heavy metal-associated domain-containing protein [Conchiformibius sp.]|nr:heavy metal-associated domain-containing protein [Conchiformibius sp.]